MSVEDFENVLGTRANPNSRTGDTFTNEPITPEESSWPPVQRITVHGALFNGPFGEDDEAGPKGTGMVSLAVGENGFSLVPDAIVVPLDPDLL